MAVVEETVQVQDGVISTIESKTEFSYKAEVNRLLLSRFIWPDSRRFLVPE
jgi:hypothetical protein